MYGKENKEQTSILESQSYGRFGPGGGLRAADGHGSGGHEYRHQDYWSSNVKGQTISNADDIYNISGAVNAGGDTTWSGGTLNVGGSFIFGGTATGNGNSLAFANGNKFTFAGGKITATEIIFGETAAGDTLNLTSTASNADNEIGIYIGGSAPAAPAASGGPAGIIAADKLTFIANGSVWKPKNTTIYLGQDGVFTVAPNTTGTSKAGSIMNNEQNAAVDANRLVMTGGTLNMDGAAGTGRYLDFNDVTISGGEVVIGGNFKGLSNTYEYAALYGNWDVNNKFDITGGTITLKDWGSLGVYGDVTANADKYNLNIKGGTVNMTGSSAAKSSIIRASSAHNVSDTSSGHYSYVNISGNGVINVADGKYGAIASRFVNMSGGTINVGGTLTLAGSVVFQNDEDVDISSDLAVVAQKWGDFTFSGGAINIGASGLMDLATHNIDFIADGNGAFSGNLNVAEAAGTAKGTLYARNVSVDVGDTLNVTNLKLAAADNTKSKLTVNGTLKVGGSLSTAGAIAGSLAMGANGVLVANYADLLTQKADGSFALAAANSTWNTVISATDGAQVTLNSAETIQYTTEQLAKLNNNGSLLGTNVAATLANGALKAAEGAPQDAEGNAIITVGDGSGSSVTAPTTTGTANEVNVNAAADSGNAVTITGSDLKAKTITVSDTATTTVKISTDTTISGIGGTEGTALVAKGENKQAVEQIELAADKALNLGVANSSTQQGGKVGDVKLAAGSSNTTVMNVNNGSFGAGNIAMAGKGELNVNNAALTAGNITDTGATASSSISVVGSETAAASLTAKAIAFNGTTDNGKVEVVNGTLTADSIKGNGTKAVTITVGDATAAGQLIAASVENANLIVDPAFGPNTPSSTAIVGAISSVNTLVAQNSWLALGDKGTVAEAEAWMTRQIPGGKLTPTGYTAALAIRAPMLLNTGKELVVNGDGTLNGSYAFSNANTATFEDQSLLIVDAAGLRNTDGKTTLAALEAQIGGTAVVDADATLKIVGGSVNDEITVLKNFTVVTDVKGWGITTSPNKTTLLFDNDYITAVATDISTTGGYTVKITANEKAIDDLPNRYPLMSSGMTGMLKNFITDGALNKYPNNAGVAFVSNLLRNDVPGLTATEAARTLEGAARIAAVAGVPTLASGLGAQVSGLVVDHNSMLNAVQPAFGSEPGQIGLWLTPFYRSSDVDGMDAGRFENAYELNYGGAAFGLDYNVSENFRLGLALNAGGGDSETQGGGKGFNKTENDFDFWGLSLYGSYTNGSFGLTADAGYTSLDNEITQDVPRLNDRLKADGGSDLFTLGLTGEYRVTTDGGFAVTPHAGLRYTSISTDDSLLKDQDSNRILDVSTDDQNLFQIPLGVKFGKDIVTDGGWTVTPTADLGVLFTMGDTDVDSKTTISGTPYSGVTNTEVVDKAAFTGALGLQAKADNGLTLGLEYGLLASGNQTGHSVNGLLRFEF